MHSCAYLKWTYIFTHIHTHTHSNIKALSLSFSLTLSLILTHSHFYNNQGWTEIKGKMITHTYTHTHVCVSVVWFELVSPLVPLLSLPFFFFVGEGLFMYNWSFFFVSLCFAFYFVFGIGFHRSFLFCRFDSMEFSAFLSILCLIIAFTILFSSVFVLFLLCLPGIWLPILFRRWFFFPLNFPVPFMRSRENCSIFSFRTRLIENLHRSYRLRGPVLSWNWLG